MSFPSVVATGDDFKNYRVSGIPTMFVIDREGKIVYAIHNGFSDARDHSAVEEHIK